MGVKARNRQGYGVYTAVGGGGLYFSIYKVAVLTRAAEQAKEIARRAVSHFRYQKMGRHLIKVRRRRILGTGQEYHCRYQNHGGNTTHKYGRIFYIELYCGRDH